MPEAQFVTRKQSRTVLAYLAKAPSENLFLIDLVQEIARSWRDPGVQVVAAWEGKEVVGVASLRPSVATDAAMSEAALSACLPLIMCLEMGLIKSAPDHAEVIWNGLQVRGRRASIDRRETAYVHFLDGPSAAWASAPPGVVLRKANMDDLESLVYAARASLLEESRPDPFDGDIPGFRRWVAGRVERARLVEVKGEAVFVAYADVRQPDGWLVQGVYTWPGVRRRGYARLGMSALLREARAQGATHLQLAVVSGNAPAAALYSGLGFSPRFDLRTILFS